MARSTVRMCQTISIEQLTTVISDHVSRYSFRGFLEQIKPEIEFQGDRDWVLILVYFTVLKCFENYVTERPVEFYL